jgi:hypothetical protein
LPVPKSIKVALPATAAALPIAVEAFRACTTRAGIWFWGDQALIDIEARDSLVGRNLLGVYDRYGWHHLGPMWLALLGVFRWLGGGAPAAVVLGYCVLQAAAAVGIVVVANRLRPGLTAWWAALLVVAYEWSFWPDRIGTVWAPYAIALPAALLVLLVADIASNPNPWGPTIGAAVVASFLAQTDIGTIVLVAALVVVAPLLRMASQVWSETSAASADGATRPRHRTRAEWGWSRWGWSTGSWRGGAGALVGVFVVLWLPPLIQQFSTNPGNLVQAFRFVTSHPAQQGWHASLRAADTVFGSFPFRLGSFGSVQDASPVWLVAHPVWDHPWYLLYLLVTLAAGTLAWKRRQREALALAAASAVAMLAVGLSIHSVYGPLFPYLIFWGGAVAVPAWVAWWLAFGPPVAAALSRGVSALRGVRVLPGQAALAVRVAASVAAVAVGASFAAGRAPMTGVTSQLAHHSWEAVAGPVLAPQVKTVYIDFLGADAMPVAASIADQAMRHGRRVEVDKSALYFVDPSLAPRWAAQLDVVVCCGVSDPGPPPVGMTFRRYVGHQRIYTSAQWLPRDRVLTPFLRGSEATPVA